MQMAVYVLTRLILFGFGCGVAGILALAADELLPGVKWPILGISAAWWTFICALYVASEARTRDQAAEFQHEPESL